MSSWIREELVTSLGSQWLDLGPWPQPHVISLPHSLSQTLSFPLILYTSWSLFAITLTSNFCGILLLFHISTFWFFLFDFFGFICPLFIISLWLYYETWTCRKPIYIISFCITQPRNKCRQMMEKSLMIVLLCRVVSYINSTSHIPTFMIFHPSLPASSLPRLPILVFITL